MQKRNFELVNIGCDELLVMYHNIKVGGWEPKSGIFREWGTSLKVHLPTKRDLVLFVVSRFGILETL
jgi:hypothetical protein